MLFSKNIHSIKVKSSQIRHTLQEKLISVHAILFWNIKNALFKVLIAECSYHCCFKVGEVVKKK